MNYTYDALYRLSSAETNGSTGYPQWGMAWVYDRYGNRTQQNWVAGSVPTNSLTINTLTNRISSGSGFGYDSNGNMTGDGINTLTYDSENHALTSSGTYGTGQYVYDGKGMRVEKCLSTCGSPTTYTVYIFAGTKVIAEYDNGASVSSPSREYLYNGGQLMATIDSSGMRYHLTDRLSVRATTDASGSKIGDQGHYPYGDLWYAVNTTTNWFFTSYERDAESSNDYAQGRYNVNRLRRFASPDTIAGNAADPQTLNRYSYVRNMPLNFVDPTGMYGCATADDWKRSTGNRGTGSGPSDNNLASELEPQNGCGGNGPECSSYDMPIPCDVIFGDGGGRESLIIDDYPDNYVGPMQNQGTFDDQDWEPGLSLGGLPLSFGAGSLIGLGGGGVHNSWGDTFHCNYSSAQVAAYLEANFAKLASTVVTQGPAVNVVTFTATNGISPGSTVTTNVDTIIGSSVYHVPIAQAQLSVVSTSNTGFVLQSDPTKSPLNGTLTFSATPAGNNSQVSFSIRAQGSYTSFPAQVMAYVGKSLENGIWNNLVSEIQAFCNH